MAEGATPEELQDRLRELDAEIAQLQGISVSGDAQAGVRDPEEIANDLTSREEQQAVLAILQRRRDSIAERLAQLGG